MKTVCGKQCFDTINRVLDSKPVAAVAIIVSVASIALGALALTGMFYPTSPLGTYTALLGPMGTFATLGLGLGVLVAIVVLRCKEKKPPTPTMEEFMRSIPSSNPYDTPPQLPPSVIVPNGDTGLGCRG